MEKKDFFVMPHAIIDSGLWSLMKPSEKAVYSVLCRYRNYKTGYCFPGIKLISEKSGIHKNRVCAAVQQLCVYGLIRKKRAPRGLKFRNIYNVILNPKLDPTTLPQNADKKCKDRYREKSGKFGVTPQNAEADTLPQNAEAVVPQKAEKKESKMKERGIRDSTKRAPQLTYSKETLKELLKIKGRDWLVKTLKSYGYTEDQINSSLKGIEGKKK